MWKSQQYGLFIGHIPIAPAISEFSSGCIQLSPWQWKGGIWIIYGLSSAFTMHGTPNYDRDFHFMDHDHPYYIGLQPWLYPAYKTGSRTVRPVEKSCTRHPNRCRILQPSTVMMWIKQCHVYRPPVITISIGGKNHSQSRVVYGIVLTT